MPQTDRELVTLLLGREPMGEFTVVVRRDDGSPVVLSNQPLLDTGRPMPTRFWLADSALNRAIGQLESTGAVNRAEREIPAEAIAATHSAAESERDTHLSPDHSGPRPSGGVGGTRMGVKCLHAHYANLLAGAQDVVGQWTHEQLCLMGQEFDPSQGGIVTKLARQQRSHGAQHDDEGSHS